MSYSSAKQNCLHQFGSSATGQLFEPRSLAINEAVYREAQNTFSTGKSLSEALLFAEQGENMLCTKIVRNVRHNFCTQHVLLRFELRIFMY